MPVMVSRQISWVAVMTRGLPCAMAYQRVDPFPAAVSLGVGTVSLVLPISISSVSVRALRVSDQDGSFPVARHTEEAACADAGGMVPGIPINKVPRARANVSRLTLPNILRRTPVTATAPGAACSTG